MIQKIAVFNPKGGTGKSTVSAHLVMPYLFKATNTKNTLFEVDEVNKDGKSYKSDLFFYKNIGSVDIDFKLIDVFTKDSFCIDIGGNSNTYKVFDSLLEASLFEELELIIIPIGDGETDLHSGMKIYKKIKESNYKGRFIFVLTKYQNNLQFFEFLGDRKGVFGQVTPGIGSTIEKEDRIVFNFNQSETIKYARKLKKTIFELSDTNELKILIKKMKIAKAEKNNDLQLKYRYQALIKRKMIKYNTTTVLPFIKLVESISNSKF